MDDTLYENEVFDGRYKLIEKKGQGAFGQVWKALDEHLDLEVAIKIYLSLDQADNEEFKSEFKTTFQLNHPNLLKPTFFGLCGDRAYVVMPYCSTVAAQLIGCCEEKGLWRFIGDVAKGLAYLHGCDIIHHDIKPDNILIGEAGNYMISDFGISKKIRSVFRRNSAREEKPSDDESKDDPMNGSVAYMAPEMFLDEPFAVKASDIWALGATLYEMVTGELPFFGQGGAMQNNGAEIPTVQYEFISDSIKQLITHCLAKEPWDRPSASEIAAYTRYRSEAGEVAMDWQSFYTKTKGIDALPSTPQPQSQPAPKRSMWWIPVTAGAAVVFAALVLTIVLVLRSPRPDPMTLLPKVSPADSIALADSMSASAPQAEPVLVINPKSVVKDFHQGEKTIAVTTNGKGFSVDTSTFPAWLALGTTTDSTFVLHFVNNNTIYKRQQVIKVTSGDLTSQLTIVQNPDEKKVNESKLTLDKGQ